MPDIQNLTVTQLANATISMPRWSIAGQVVRSQAPHDMLADFTGANAIVFPTILSTLTAAQRLQLLDLILRFLIEAKTGL
jgi:hypothetical protein